MGGSLEFNQLMCDFIFDNQIRESLFADFATYIFLVKSPESEFFIRMDCDFFLLKFDLEPIGETRNMNSASFAFAVTGDNEIFWILIVQTNPAVVSDSVVSIEDFVLEFSQVVGQRTRGCFDRLVISSHLQDFELRIGKSNSLPQLYKWIKSIKYLEEIRVQRDFFNCPLSTTNIFHSNIHVFV